MTVQTLDEFQYNLHRITVRQWHLRLKLKTLYRKRRFLLKIRKVTSWNTDAHLLFLQYKKEIKSVQKALKQVNSDQKYMQLIWNLVPSRLKSA